VLQNHLSVGKPSPSTEYHSIVTKMSFDFGVGDFLDVCDLAKAIVDACSGGPREFRELSKVVEAM
jgi:hypothetical protein